MLCKTITLNIVFRSQPQRVLLLLNVQKDQHNISRGAIFCCIMKNLKIFLRRFQKSLDNKTPVRLKSTNTESIVSYPWIKGQRQAAA